MSIGFDFIDKTVLVTGGTKGIGAQVAIDFYNAGANLIITGTTNESIDKIRSNFVGKEGSVYFFAVDFSKMDITEKFLVDIEKFEKIDILINNSGINRINYIDETTISDWDYINSVNLKAPFLLIRQISKKMKKFNYGRIINIGSIFGIISKPKRSIYSATKHGLHGLTIASALDLAPYGILVNTISPGFVLTDLTKSILNEKEIEDLSRQVPLNRFASPEEISNVVLFLASNKNSFITSQNIIVDGGFVNV